MKIDDLYPLDFDKGLADAVAVLSQGIANTPLGLATPILYEPKAEARLPASLARVRESQIATAARVYADAPGLDGDALQKPHARAYSSTGQRAANLLVRVWERTGRELLGREQPAPATGDADRKLFDYLTALAAPEVPRQAASGRMLRELVRKGGSSTELGLFLAAFVELAMPAAIGSPEALATEAEKVAVRLVPHVKQEMPSVEIDLLSLVEHTLRFGARRIAWRTGMRKNP